MSLHILARQFLRKATNSPNLVVNKSCRYLYNLSLGRLLEGDPLECYWLRLCFKPLCIQFVRFATLYSYLVLYYY